MTDKQSKFLENLQKHLEGGAVQPEELITALDAILKVINDTKNALLEEIKGVNNSTNKSLIADLNRIKAETQKTINEYAKIASGDLSKFKTEVSSQIKQLQNFISDNSRFSSIEEVITQNVSELQEKINTIEKKIPSVPEPFSGEEMKKKVVDAGLTINDIKGLIEKLEKIETAMNTKQGTVGGVSNLRIQQAFKYILKTEQPTGDIDGSNTTYTLSQTIFAVLAFSLNGETIAQLPNYTIKGNKIIFNTALPSDYSGMDFEIKYI